jgi:hypothetical protein
MMYVLFLGPFFLALYFLETRRTYPAVRYMALTGLAVMVLCAYLMVTFTFNPFYIRIAYLVLFMSLVAGAWFYCWGVDVRAKSPTAKPKPVLSFSRACAWMVVMGLLFLGLNNITQAIYFWLLGEHVAVFFSPHANIFQLWMLVGLIYGFFWCWQTIPKNTRPSAKHAAIWMPMQQTGPVPTPDEPSWWSNIEPSNRRHPASPTRWP